MSSDEDLGLLPPKRKKGVRNTSNYVKEKRKITTMKGEKYANSRGHTVAEKKGGETVLIVVVNINAVVSFLKKIRITLLFLYTQQEQDTFLIGNIECFDVQRPKSDNDSKKKKNSSFK